MHALSAIFSLLVAIAGWHYLFYSTAATQLVGIEEQRLNRKRVRLRRLGGVCMLALGGCFFAGFWAFDLNDLHGRADAFAIVWLAVGVLILTIVVLALIDLTLTARLRRQIRNRKAEH